MAELKVGDKAPVFCLPDQDGKKVCLKDFKGKTVVLYFYPKDMTSGCTQQACDFRDQKKKFTKKDVVILGVSKDSSDRHTKFQEKYELNFTLLADEEAEVCKSYDVFKEKSLYGRKFMGIVRTTFVIDPAGKIAKIYPKVKVNGHVEEVLASL